MSGVPFSPRRVGLIAQNTLRDAARQKLFHFFLLLALALVVGARWLRDFNFGAPELKFLADCGFGAMALFGAALMITATAQLFCGESESRTVETVLAKPVWRAEFVLGKFLGAIAVAAIFCVTLTVALAAVLWWREGELARDYPEAFAAGRQVSYANLWLAGWLHWLRLVVLGGLVLLVASYARTQLFAVAMGFLVWAICQFQALAHDAYARSSSAAARAVGAGIAVLFPNFQLFTLADGLAAADAPPVLAVVRVTAYALLYAAAGAALAIFSFRRREL
ncbi:MAG TPA: ABC transporter permease subunit [Opitutaceae bacterium]|nr:ABC transporter permease subunit [Opitutaceae bacterium]